MGIVKNTIYAILGIDSRKDVGTNLTPDYDEQKKALAQENATLKGQLAMIQIGQKAQAENEKQKDKVSEEIKALREDERKINLERYGETISLGKFFSKFMNDKNFREKLYLTDKNGVSKFGKFGDIQITKNRGTFLITDSNFNPVIESRSIEGLFYKPNSLDNHLEVGRIPLPVDENFNQVVDIEELDMPEVDEVSLMNDFDPDKPRYYLTREARRKVKDLIIEKLKLLNEKSEQIEVLELTNNDLVRQIGEIKRANNILKNQVQTQQGELSNAMGMTMQFNTKIGEMQSKITSLTEMKAFYERKVMMLEGINQKIIEKLEKSGDKTLYEAVRQDLFTDLQEMKTLLPETVIQEAPKEVRDPVKAGQILPSSRLQ